MMIIILFYFHNTYSTYYRDLHEKALVHVFDLAWSIGAPVAKHGRLKFEKNPPAEGITDNDIDDTQK